MTEDEKKLIQARHRLEAVQARNRRTGAQGANPPTYPRGRDTGKRMAGGTRHPDG